MEKDGFSKFCNVCKTTLKRQVLGSNVFYYCRNCGSVSSEVCMSKEISILHVQKPLFVQKASAVTDLKFSEDTQKAVVEN